MRIIELLQLYIDQKIEDSDLLIVTIVDGNELYTCEYDNVKEYFNVINLETTIADSDMYTYELVHRDWTKVYEHTVNMLLTGLSLGVEGVFYVIGCQDLLDRYKKGERSSELYKAMEDLH